MGNRLLSLRESVCIWEIDSLTYSESLSVHIVFQSSSSDARDTQTRAKILAVTHVVLCVCVCVYNRTMVWERGRWN